MKYFHLAIAIVITMTGCGRLVRVPESERVIRQVFNVQYQKNEIFDRSLEWCAKNLSSVNEAVIVRDREKGKIIGKGTGKYSEYFDVLVDREFSYTVTIEVKDNRYRVTFDNLTVYYDERQMRSSRAEYRFEIDKISEKLKKLMESLREYVSRGVAEKEEKKKEEEW